MTRLDLSRVLSLLLESEPTAWRRRVVASDVAELSDWIARKGRMPTFSWAGSKTENAMALRLHAYAVRLANEDNIPSPENPLIAPRADVARRPKPVLPPRMDPAERARLEAHVRERWAAEDADQSFWPEGPA